MPSPLVNLTVNPCKMCMPLGSVSALCGIGKCMNILHGSQGCSTYIRRHMATHYNEPVDIASSALTEEGTVFGGEKNLFRGLDNLISLYAPEVIGVSATCLAETIGEDLPAMIRRYYAHRPDCAARIITVPAAGYAGTRYEGWFRALRALVSQIGMQPARHRAVNVITGPISPADTRALKRLLRSLGLEYILLPDISTNLDGGREEPYRRLPSGGTPLARAAEMAGAAATLELAPFCPQEISPGRYLEETHGVPLIRLNLPVGLRDTDAFLEALAELGGVVPDSLREERGRYLDAMVDAHKHNALGRAALFGEPDLVYCLVRLCCENGLLPVTAATGANRPDMAPFLEAEIRPLAENLPGGTFDILHEADFEDIERSALANGANLLIGSSDGRRLAEKHHLPLVRCAFPVHDQVGGQRIRVLGYSGSLRLLDSCANALLGRLEGGFRRDLFARYYRTGNPEQGLPAPPEPAEAASRTAEPDRRAANEEKTRTHPCFDCTACRCSGRIHLPVAPACNIGCNYCLRRTDCLHESRPGVTSWVITPREACARFLRMKAEMPFLTVAGIAGPGDALANFGETAETLRLIREADRTVTFCLSTNGLLLPLYAQSLIDLGVSHVTITVNAVDPAIGAKTCSHVHYLGREYRGETGAAVLLANQLAGLKFLADRGVVCKVNIVLLKGINDAHIEDVVLRVRDLGAYITNIMQMIPVKGSAFEHMPQVSNKEHLALRRRCAGISRQMFHCRQCRSDAVGLLEEDRSYRFSRLEPPAGGKRVRPLKIAVASRSGVVVDQHFGQAEQFYIYESDGISSRLVETRRLGAPGCACAPRAFSEAEKEGPDGGKILRAVEAVADCKGVLALRIGRSPERKLAERGIAVFATYDDIDKAVREAALHLAG